MNTWLSWRSDARFVPTVRAALRRGRRLSHHLLSVVGALAVAVALALWMLPAMRGTLAAKLMPVLSAAVQAGPARLLSGHPLPAIGRTVTAKADGSIDAAGAGAARYDGAFDGSGGSGLGQTSSGAPWLQARASALPGLVAKMISSQPISPDARDDRVLVSAREQQLVTSFLARRYHVAREPVAQLVKAAFATGREVGLDPLLLLAVMAIESGFNPYAESGVGARGLMQVMAKVHSDKFRYFGGPAAALQPLANITVGALVLKDCIARGGSLPGGLRLYVGSTSPNDGGYGAKVMAERDRLRAVARGRSVPINAPQAPQSPRPHPVVASTKRVQVALTGNPGSLVTKTVAPAGSAPSADDNGASATHSGSALGA